MVVVACACRVRRVVVVAVVADTAGVVVVVVVWVTAAVVYGVAALPLRAAGIAAGVCAEASSGMVGQALLVLPATAISCRICCTICMPTL